MNLFPESFEFYHLGNVEKQLPISSVQSLELDGRSGVSFNLYGDTTGLIVFLFEEGLDVSTYTEMGNVLASRMATQLSIQQGWDVMISPPRFLNSAQLRSQLLPPLQALERLGQQISAQQYLHQVQLTELESRILELQLVVLTTQSGIQA